MGLHAATAPFELIPNRTQLPVCYIASAAGGGSDGHDGLTPKTAKATLAGALAALGGTAINTNAGVIQFLYGSFTETVTCTIAGVQGFQVRGLGPALTTITGPDAAPLFLVSNGLDCLFEDFTYYGSPSGTGWGIEFVANRSGGVFVGGVTATRNRVRHITFGHVSTPIVAAYGIKFSILNGDSANDANNDQSTIEDCIFSRIAQPIEIAGQNSLWHNINDCWFPNCSGGIRFYAGSATINNPRIGGSLCAGWFLDIQDPPVGAVYRHKIMVYGAQAEQGNQGWVRSTPGAGASIAGTPVTLNVSFVACDLKLGGVAGSGSLTVDWQAVSTTTNPYAYLSFVSCRLGGWYTNLIINASDPTSSLAFVDCQMHGFTFTWGGRLRFVGCDAWSAHTFQPIATATHAEQDCLGSFSGYNFPGAGLVTPKNSGLLGWTYPYIYAVGNMASVQNPGVILMAAILLEKDGPISEVDYDITTAAVTPTPGQCFVGIYDALGNLLGVSADISAALTVGVKSTALVAPTAAQAAGSKVWAALLFNGTTAPILRATGTTPLQNYGLAGATNLCGTSGNGLTALPASVATAFGGFAASPWFGVK